MNLHRDPLRRTTLLELAAPFPLHFSIQHGKTVCSASGMSWQMNAEVAERLRAFNDGCPHAIGELFPVQDVRDTGLLGVMVMKGVLRRVSDSPNGNS